MAVFGFDLISSEIINLNTVIHCPANRMAGISGFVCILVIDIFRNAIKRRLNQDKFFNQDKLIDYIN